MALDRLKRSSRGGGRGRTADVSSHLASDDILSSSMQTQSRSQPIPIKHSKKEPESIDPYDEVDTQAQYDMATWNMYMLITTARRLRAIHRNMNGFAVQAPVVAIVKPSISEIDESRRQGSTNPFSPALSPEPRQSPFDLCYDGVFELE